MNLLDRSTPTQPDPTQPEAKTINDRQSTLFDLDQYECESLVKWGWLDPDVELGSKKNLVPNAQVGEQSIDPDSLLPNARVRAQSIDPDSLLPNFGVREQTKPDSLLPNFGVREQKDRLLPNLEIVKVKGRSYSLTPTKGRKLLPKERSWYDIKNQKGHQYLYLRWREEKTQKSRCLGRIDELKYSE